MGSWNNECRLLGHVGSIELNEKRTRAVVSLATNTRYMKDGQDYEETDWHRVIVFDLDRLGRAAKGSLVQCIGRLRYNKVDRDGRTIKFPEIVCASFVVLKDPAAQQDEQQGGAGEDEAFFYTAEPGDFPGQQDLEDEPFHR